MNLYTFFNLSYEWKFYAICNTNIRKSLIYHLTIKDRYNFLILHCRKFVFRVPKSVKGICLPPIFISPPFRSSFSFCNSFLFLTARIGDFINHKGNILHSRQAKSIATVRHIHPLTNSERDQVAPQTRNKKQSPLEEYGEQDDAWFHWLGDKWGQLKPHWT